MWGTRSEGKGRTGWGRAGARFRLRTEAVDLRAVQGRLRGRHVHALHLRPHRPPLPNGSRSGAEQPGPPQVSVAGAGAWLRPVHCGLIPRAPAPRFSDSQAEVGEGVD